MDEPKLDKVLDSFPTRVMITYANYLQNMDESIPPEVTIVLSFSEKGYGFGEIALRQTPEGLFLDTEHTSLDRVKRYVNNLLDSAVLDTDMDPERHGLYNRVMGRRCGDGCPICSEHE